VTSGQFAAFIKATGYRPQGQDGAGGCPASPSPADGEAEAGGAVPAAANDPVVCVSWIDADAYVEWLRQSSGLKFRLPTAAEWELAAYAAGSVAEPTPDSPAEVPPESPSEVSVGDLAGSPTGDAVETLAEDAVASPAESLAEGAVVSPIEDLADNLPEKPAATPEPTSKRARIEHLSASRSEWVQDCATPASPDGAQDRSEPCLKHVAARYRPPGTSSEAAGDPRVVLGNGYRADNLGFRLAL
jgi:hypothetical protein